MSCLQLSVFVEFLSIHSNAPILLLMLPNCPTLQQVVRVLDITLITQNGNLRWIRYV